MSTETPAGSLWIDSIKGQSFQDISIDDTQGINTEEFIRACRSLITLFDRFKDFTMDKVKDDLVKNTNKVEKRFNEDPANSQTLQDLVRNDQPGKNKKPATQGLAWLYKALAFTALGIIHNLENPSVSLSSSFSTVHPDTLKDIQGWGAVPFAASLYLVPTRENFYGPMGYTPEQLIYTVDQQNGLPDHYKALYDELAAVRKVVDILDEFRFQQTPQEIKKKEKPKTITSYA